MTKCKNKACGQQFTPTKPMQSACCLGCAISIGRYKTLAAQEKAAKADRKETAIRKLALKSKADWLREAQQAVNAFIRERDHALPCISCRRHHTGQYHAGHYQNVGSHPALRFNELNIHKQCAPCNNNLGGNKILYRAALIAKEGIGTVEFLEGRHDALKYTTDDLKDIRDTHRKRLKVLQAKHEQNMEAA